MPFGPDSGQPETVTSASRPVSITPRHGPVERRRKQRFPLACRLWFRTLGRTRAQIEGTGWTINISSRGFLFAAEHTLNPGERLRIALEWPVKQGHQLPLELTALAKVVRWEKHATAVELLHSELRLEGSGGET